MKKIIFKLTAPNHIAANCIESFGNIFLKLSEESVGHNLKFKMSKRKKSKETTYCVAKITGDSDELELMWRKAWDATIPLCKTFTAVKASLTREAFE